MYRRRRAAIRTPRAPHPSPRRSAEENLMLRFNLTPVDLSNPKLRNLFVEKLELEREIKAAKADEVVFSPERLSKALAQFGLCASDFADRRIAWLLKACIHSQLMLAALTSTTPKGNENYEQPR